MSLEVFDPSKYLGWHKEHAAATAAAVTCKFADLPMSGKPLGRTMLWETVRYVLGEDIKNYAQLETDCVGFGGKNATEYLQCLMNALGHDVEYKPLFVPFTWGMGRLSSDIGNNRIGCTGGSVGQWQAQASVEYGYVYADAPGVPKYSSNAVWKYGCRPGPSQDLVSLGKKHIVKAYNPIRTTAELRLALDGANPVTIASDVGFDMQQRSDGFYHYSTHWGHQMTIIGYDDGDGINKPPCFCVLNSWGDVFGKIMDWRYPDVAWPVGTLRVMEKDVQTILDAQDSFAYNGLGTWENVAGALPSLYR